VFHKLAADLLVVIHALFVLFVVLGGVVVWRWPRLAWLHLPAAAWGAWIEFTGSICPLTPLEQSLRRAAGGIGYEGGFIDHYLLPVLYPAGMERGAQWTLGLLVVGLNLAIYGRLLLRRGKRPRQG